MTPHRRLWPVLAAMAALLLACSDESAGAGGAGSTATGGGTFGGGGTGGGAAVGGGGAGGGPSTCFEGSAEVQGTGPFTATTAHYRLVSEMPQARTEEMAQMLEASWEPFAVFFGGAPADAGPHTIKLYADYDGWAAGLAADGLGVPANAGGYYDPYGGTAYLYDQPTRYFTHTLLLHEAAHQYHHLTGAPVGLPAWYVEGVAEHISRHDWDGRCVRLGVQPLLTQEDYPAQALGEVNGVGADLDGIVSGASNASRPMMWAVFRYLETQLDGFAAYRAAVDGGAEPWSTFTADFGQPSAFEAGFTGWLAGEQEPMTPVYVEWQHVGPTSAIGDTQPFSIARVKGGVQHFEAAFDAPPQGTSAGVLLSFDDPDDWTAFVIDGAGAASTFEVIAGNATWWGQGTVPAAAGHQVAVDHLTAGKAEVSVDGAPFGSLDIAAAPAGGLALDHGRLRFRAIAWQ